MNEYGFTDVRFMLGHESDEFLKEVGNIYMFMNLFIMRITENKEAASRALARDNKVICDTKGYTFTLTVEKNE